MTKTSFAKRRARTFVAALGLGASITGCARRDPPAQPAPIVTVDAAAESPVDTTTLGVEADVAVPRSGRCPAGMRLVVGEYCHFLRHGCRVGRLGKAGEYCPEGCDFDPTECQEWIPGTAWCQGSKPIVVGNEIVRYEPEYTHVEVCMDEHEWPNRVGEKPTVFVSWFDAQKLCGSVGKRLCTSAEFTTACEGPERRPTATGWKIDGAACNVDRPARSWHRPGNGSKEGFAEVDQREPSGARPLCVSPHGVFDLTGNVDEWTTLDPVDRHQSGHPSQLKGGYYAKGAHPFCRAHTDLHPPDFDFYQIGTRCCATPYPP